MILFGNKKSPISAATAVKRTDQQNRSERESNQQRVIPFETVWNRMVLQTIAVQAKENTILANVLKGIGEIESVEFVVLVNRGLSHR